MRNVLFRKGMVFAVIVLFVGAGVVPTISGYIRNKIYVDNDHCKVLHIWTEKGNYNITAKAKDRYGKVSAWSDSISIRNEGNSNLLKGGWLEERDGVKICHISGSHYQMGYQYGFLLKDEIEQNLHAIDSWLGYSIENWSKAWNETKEFIPTIYKEEIFGLLDGCNLSNEKKCIINLPVIHNFKTGCCGSVAWGNATKNNHLYHIRSLDLGGLLKLTNPVTWKTLCENQVLLIRNPNDGYKSMSPSVAGDLGYFGGINEKGIGVSWVSQFSYEQSKNGMPPEIKVKMILDYCSTAEEALNIINSSPTVPLGFIISDGKKPVGYVIEQTANNSYIGTWNNSIESTHPFWSINQVIRRTNIFLDPDLAANQRKYYNPSIFPLFAALFKINKLAHTFIPASVPWIHYKALSNGIENIWGEMNLNNTMKMVQQVYTGKMDPYFFIIQTVRGYIPLHQWVACPKSGDMVISFSNSKKDAQYRQFHYFNLYEESKT